MNYQETIELMDSKNKETCLNEKAFANLLNKMNNPQKDLKIIVVTGSTARKSCSSMIAKSLNSAGYKTGLLQSDYFISFNERLRIDGRDIENNDIVSLGDAVKSASELIDENCRDKDFIFSSAMVYFRDFECQATIIEMQFINEDIEAVLNSLDVDCFVILDNGTEECKQFSEFACKNGINTVSDANLLDNEKFKSIGNISSIFDSFEGQSFEYEGREYALATAGKSQLKNAAVAIEVCNILNDSGLKISSMSVEEGIYSAPCPATFELVSDEPYFVLEYIEDLNDMNIAAETINNYFAGSGVRIILSFDYESNWREMTDAILSNGFEYIVAGSESGDTADWKEVSSYIESKGYPVTGCETADDAISVAIDEGGDMGTIFAVGNGSLCGVVRSFFGLGGKNI